MPKVPFTRFRNPFCSLFWLSVCNALIASIGGSPDNARSASTAPSSVRPVRPRSLSASLGAFAPPAGVARLVIARDNDEDGALAAERLARRCARAGISATVVVPVGNDFNDDLVALGAPALRARLAPLLRSPLVDRNTA